MSKRPYVLLGNHAGVARSGKEIFITYYVKEGCKMHTDLQSECLKRSDELQDVRGRCKLDHAVKMNFKSTGVLTVSPGSE